MLIAESIFIASVASVHRLVASVHMFHRIKCQLLKIVTLTKNFLRRRIFYLEGLYFPVYIAVVWAFIFLKTSPYSLHALASLVRFTWRNNNTPEGGLFGASVASVHSFHGIECKYSECHTNKKILRRSIFYGEIKMWYKVFATHFLMIKW